MEVNEDNITSVFVTDVPNIQGTRELNSTLGCYSLDTQPTFLMYSSALQMYGTAIWTTGGVLCLMTLMNYFTTLRAVKRNQPSIFNDALYVLAVYPLVSISAFLSTLFPRTRLVAEALSQHAVMMGMSQLFWLLIHECGGLDALVRRAENARLETRVLPCCCWPCCLIPRPELTKRNLNVLRYQILQMPIIQALIYAILLTLWEEDKVLYQNYFLFLQPFVAASILLGVWGMIITVRAVESAGFNPKPKFLALQVVLIIVKVQCGFSKFLPDIVKIPCVVDLHPQIVFNLLHNTAMIGEMFLLSICVWRIYRNEPPKISKSQDIVNTDRSLEPSKIDLSRHMNGVRIM